jgi:cyclic beta-1,2-glucan synthetase
LLDNFYLIEQQITQARRHLPRGYSRQLPRLADGPSAGFPRIYDPGAGADFPTGRPRRQRRRHPVHRRLPNRGNLEAGRIVGLPIMLQLALLENLRRVGVRIAQRREELDAAIIWADRMLATAESEPKRLIQLLAEFANADVPLTAPFVEEFYGRLQAQGSAMAFVQTWVEHKLLEQGVTATELSEAAGRTAAANQISIANSIGSLRFIGATDWKQFVEALSVVEQTLCEDPTAMYANQDFATRDRYRHVIEDVARRSASSEMAVAREAIALAQATVAERGIYDRRAHVGYYLIDRGRRKLERAVGYRPALKSRLSRASPHLRLSLYVGSILVLTLLSIAGVLSVLGPDRGWVDVGDWRIWLLALPLAVAASALAVPLVNLLVTLTLPPRALPRMDFSRGIPENHRSMVIVPTLLTKLQDVDDLLEAMEIRYLGNRDPNLFFALLTDFRDAPEQTLPDDAALLDHARAAVEALNASYREDRPCIFYLFHRPRVWNPFERVWMGYERKRGKLEQFNARLRGGAQNAFRRSSAICPSSPRSSTSSPWTPTRNCRATRHAPWSATWRIRSTGRSTMRASAALSKATRSCSRGPRSA